MNKKKTIIIGLGVAVIALVFMTVAFLTTQTNTNY